MRETTNRQNSADAVWRQAYHDLTKYGAKQSPRGLDTHEILNYHIELANPMDNLVFNQYRKASPFYMVAELIWYLSGSNDVDFISYYGKFWKSIAKEDGTCPSGYGKQIFDFNALGQSQWNECIEKLSADKSSRQAVIVINIPHSGLRGERDEPCTLSLQFLIRNNQLHLITTMRSNEIFLGLPYDIFCFTCLQQIMSNALGVGLGNYYHNVGSFHLYDKDILEPHNQIEPISSTWNSRIDLSGVEPIHITRLINFEIMLRATNMIPDGRTVAMELSSCPEIIRDFGRLLCAWKAWKKIDAMSMAKSQIANINNETLRVMAARFMEG